jgi:hypothetical protein
MALGKRGGLARAQRLDPSRRRAIARDAATARWGIRLPALATVTRLSDYYRETIVKGKGKGSIKDDLVLLSDLLRDLPHAIIGGIAVQSRLREPRTTDDIDVAVPSWGDIPAALLRSKRFRGRRRFEFSENWRCPGGTAVQFSPEPVLGVPGVVARREVVSGGGLRFQSASVPDLLRLKARAALEPRRRFTKRLSDIGDLASLLDQHRDAYASLSGPERAEIDSALALAKALGAPPPAK